MRIQFLINFCIKNTNINNNIENIKYSKYACCQKTIHFEYFQNSDPIPKSSKSIIFQKSQIKKNISRLSKNLWVLKNFKYFLILSYSYINQIE